MMNPVPIEVSPAVAVRFAGGAPVGHLAAHVHHRGARALGQVGERRAVALGVPGGAASRAAVALGAPARRHARASASDDEHRRRARRSRAHRRKLTRSGAPARRRSAIDASDQVVQRLAIGGARRAPREDRARGSGAPVGGGVALRRSPSWSLPGTCGGRRRPAARRPARVPSTSSCDSLVWPMARRCWNSVCGSELDGHAEPGERGEPDQGRRPA